MSIIATLKETGISMSGELTTIFLIIFLIIAFLLIDTKYWIKINFTTIDICSSPLLLTFIAVAIFNILSYQI